MLNICITADHELFFGQNYGTEEEVLLEPTYRLMDMLAENGASLVLMSDVLSIFRYRELGMHEFPDGMEEQLLYAIKNGHDVQLHIHSHWLTSTYRQGTWNFDYTKYRIHDLGFEERDDGIPSAVEIIRKGKNYLEELLRPADSSYACRAFRAGGWNLLPERELLKSLASEGIWIDSSIFRGGRLKTGIHGFDYTKVPKSINWWIDPDLGIEHEAQKGDGRILEMVIGSYYGRPGLLAKKIENSVRGRLRKRRLGETPQRGTAFSDSKGAFETFVKRLENYIFQPIMLTYDGLCKEIMVDIVKQYLKSFDCENNDYYLSVIGHPKSMSNIGMLELEGFCRHMNKEYKGMVRFVNTSDIKI
ncbi:MAG: hypothetical protein GT589_05155 [Peptoclostridium sp.]|uniref:hypothetical protein n=1 Tax=Peptoclostridium sp. TaxID=1904860 RepID=UPI00139E561D|nr:hypothetical protein [Peptoclostridium sp.]MZQ75531.1 hypothetical protein [Peptoclostridium sp.]